MSHFAPFSPEWTADQADENPGRQSVLEVSYTPVTLSSQRCSKLQGTIAAAALLAIAGGMAFMGRSHAVTPAPNSTVSLKHSTRHLEHSAGSPNEEGASFTLNKTGVGCNNTMDARFLSRDVSSKQECAKLCRASVNCKQFNYNLVSSADSGGDNCALLKDWCVPAPCSGWELYDDAGGKTSNDATVFGFDTHWSMEGSKDFWIFDDGRVGCPRDSFKCPARGAQDLIAAGPPPEDSLEATFNSTVTERHQAGEDVCEENSGHRVFAVARLSPAGLGSRMNNFANEALWAMWAGIPLSLCTPPGVHDSWPRFFQPVDFARCGRCGTGRSIFGAGACAGAAASRSLDEGTLGHMKRFVYSKLFKFVPEVLKQRAALLKDLDLVGMPYVGVHIRRGDKNVETGESYVDVEVFARLVRERCSNCSKVYVASDWPAARDELQKQLPEMAVVAQESLPSELYDVRNDEEEDEDWKYRAETSFVIDLSMLVHADVFIGTASSNVGRFVYFMRPKDKVSVSLDKGGSFLSLNC